MHQGVLLHAQLGRGLRGVSLAAIALVLTALLIASAAGSRDLRFSVAAATLSAAHDLAEAPAHGSASEAQIVSAKSAGQASAAEVSPAPAAAQPDEQRLVPMVAARPEHAALFAVAAPAAARLPARGPPGSTLAGTPRA